MEYKLIAIDMDGTLLRDDNRLSDRTIKALNLAREKGVQIVFATGRMLKSAINYSNSLDLREPIISCNGAIVVDEDKKIIYEAPLDEETIVEIADIAEENKVYYHYYGRDCIYGPRNIHIADKFYNQDIEKEEEIIKTYEVKNIEDLLDRDRQVYKFIFLDESGSYLEDMKKKLACIDRVNISSSWTNNIEIMGKNVSKGNSLEFLCKKLNIEASSVIAIGDNHNDISMLNFAGLSVAMGNAEDEVKDMANIITDTNNNDGVAKIIEEYILI